MSEWNFDWAELMQKDGFSWFIYYVTFSPDVYTTICRIVCIKDKSKFIYYHHHLALKHLNLGIELVWWWLLSEKDEETIRIRMERVESCRMTRQIIWMVSMFTDIWCIIEGCFQSQMKINTANAFMGSFLFVTFAEVFILGRHVYQFIIIYRLYSRKRNKIYFYWRKY